MPRIMYFDQPYLSHLMLHVETSIEVASLASAARPSPPLLFILLTRGKDLATLANELLYLV